MCRVVLCCVVLFCVVLCCVVLCCVVLCCVVLCCVVLCCVVLCCAVLCCVVLCCAVLCCVVYTRELCDVGCCWTASGHVLFRQCSDGKNIGCTERRGVGRRIVSDKSVPLEENVEQISGDKDF